MRHSRRKHDYIVSKKGIVDILKELEGLFLIKESILLTEDQMEAEITTLVFAWGIEFDNLTNFPKDEVRCWLFIFVNESEYQMTITQKMCSELKGIEDELFTVNVKQDIYVSLLWEYIE